MAIMDWFKKAKKAADEKKEGKSKNRYGTLGQGKDNKNTDLADASAELDKELGE